MLVVTSKVVSKVEGRLITVDNADPAARDAARMAAIDAETDRVVAQRGELKIVQTRQGLVLAAAGVDESNVAADELALLPIEPDGSAAALREGLRDRLGVDVGVIVSDSMGRPWRNGIVDQAIGVAGLRAVFDARGRLDSYGRPLLVTEVAVADEIAAAADLVKGKLSGVPVAIVRGLATDGKLVDDGLGTSTLLRDSTDDLFRLGTTEAIEVGRADAVGSRVSPPALHRAAVEAITAFVPPTLAEGSVREAFLGFLSARPDAMWRSCVAGHVTASALILDPVRRSVLLTLHPRAGMWLQVGGHCDPDDITLLDAARREAVGGERHRRSTVRSDAAQPGRARDHLFARRAHQAFRRAVRRRRSGGRRAGAQPRVARPGLVLLGRAARRIGTRAARAARAGSGAADRFDQP